MSTRGERVTIPILGMNNQLLNDQSLDGLCDSIINLKPKGSEEQPYWAPFEKINPLKNEALTDFSYAFGIASITDAFWQVRNFVGEYAVNPTGSLKRLLVLCQNESRKCIDIIDPATWTVVKTQALPQEGAYTWSCTRLDEVTVIAINRDKKPFVMYYLIDDAFIPAGWPEIAKITISSRSDTLATVDVEAGNTQGVMKKAENQWFLATWAFRLFDGTHVKHHAPTLMKVASGATNIAFIPIFTLVGYSEAENMLINQPFWKGLIAGISLCCTIPRLTEKEALDDGAFFEVGYYPWINRLPESEWTTVTDPNNYQVFLKSESWPTGKNLGIDNFTHHRYSSRVVDTYNKRLLLGGSAIDFSPPKILSNATNNSVPGGVYSDYMDYSTGSAVLNEVYYDASGSVVASTLDPAYSHTISSKDYTGQFTPKSGREFKTVTVESSVAGSGAVIPPGTGTGFPNAQYSAAITAGKLVFSIDENETTFGTGGSLPDGASMVLKVTIGPIGDVADEKILFTLSPAGDFAPYFTFSGIELLVGEATITAKIYHKITIKTDSGTYYRILTGDIADTETTVEVPELIWYPDRRATKYELIVENGASFEVAISKQLTQHPESNYSYVRLTTAEQTYTIGASIVFTDQPDITLNDVFQYLVNRIQASLSGSPFIFDPAASYRVGNRENDTILGFAINLNPTSEGQAGQYPVYALSDKGIWALEQTGDPTIAFGRISPVSNFNGINNPYAYCNAQNLIIATDNKYIYALAGLEVKRIDLQISNDPDYKDYLKQIRIGYHRATDYEEVIFTNPFYDYSLCYNMTYKVWYKATERFKFFFYDYPELMGLTVDNALKDFSNKDVESPVSWSLITRVIQYKEPYVYKRLYPFHVRMQVRQPLQENAANYLPFRMRLKGYRDDQNITYNLYDQSIKSDVVFDPRIYNQFGSMYAYRIYLDGTNNHKNGDIKWFDTDMEYRYQETRRRHNCSAQYLYTMESSSISICNCEGGSGTDAYFTYTGVATSSVVVTHALGKIPAVFVTDENGFLIDVGVQLILTAGVPSLTQIRLTFDDPIPFKAYFS